MKRILFAGLVFCFVTFLTLSGFVFASEGGNEIKKEVDGIKVELSFIKEPVKTGNNELMIKLHNDKDEPISDAKVKVTADMDRKSEMSGTHMQKFNPIIIELESSHEKGQYMGKIDLSDAGKWKLTADIITGGQKKNIDFELDVVKGGPNWGVIIAFLVVISGIIALAAIKKRKVKTQA